MMLIFTLTIPDVSHRVTKIKTKTIKNNKIIIIIMSFEIKYTVNGIQFYKYIPNANVAFNFSNRLFLIFI